MPVSADTRLRRMTAAAESPALTDQEITDLLTLWARPDSAGRLPGDTGWVPTYDLNGAAAEGWRWKAGKVAGNFNFAADGQTVSKAELIEHCLRMERRYTGGVTVLSEGAVLATPLWDPAL